MIPEARYACAVGAVSVVSCTFLASEEVNVRACIIDCVRVDLALCVSEGSNRGTAVMEEN